MLFNLLQAGAGDFADSVATAATSAAAAAPQQQEMSYSLIEMATKGGWLMIVLLLLSIIAIYIYGKKLWVITKAGKVDANLVDDIKDYVSEGKLKSAKTLCERYNNPVARMVEKGLDHYGKSTADVQSAMDAAANVEVAKLEKSLPYLAMISGGAPMIGFLGTVIGMVQAFFNMSMAGNNVDISLLSGGIYTAMITTVGGLVVGILAYFGYNHLTALVSGVVAKMESVSVEVTEILDPDNKKAPVEE